MAASVTSEPPHWNLTADRSPGANSANRFANCTATGLVPCIGGEKCSVSSCLWIASIMRRLLADRNDVDAGQGVEIAFAADIPITHTVGAGHDERMLAPFGHLIADENMAKKLLLGC